MAAERGFNWGSTGAEPSQIVHELLPHINPTARNGAIDPSIEGYLAAPQAATDIHQDAATETDPGVVEFLWRTRSVISNFGYTIFTSQMV